MKIFEKFKAAMGENYNKKVKLLAETKDVQSVNDICQACSQLLFDHNPGICTRSVAEKSTKYTADEVAEIVHGISKDVVDLIVVNTKHEMQTSVTTESFGGNESLASAFNNLAAVLKGQKQSPSQVTKVKLPPVWVKETFSDYKSEVEAWEKAHPGDDYTKYSEFLNELKRNKVRVGLSDFVSTVVIEKTRNNKTVSDILKLLEDKYELSKREKFENLVTRIKNFKPNKSDNGEQVLELIEKIQNEFDSLEIGKNLNYFLATLFLKGLLDSEIINEIEKRSIEDLFNDKSDDKIMDNVRKQFKKMKIEGKRNSEKQIFEADENKIFYVNDKNRSRYDSWKNSRDFKDFRRTGSNNWRTQSGNRWRKSQSKSASNSRPRSVSWSRDKNFEFKSLKDF